MANVEDDNGLELFIKSKREFMQDFCERIGWKFPPEERKITTLSTQKSLEPNKRKRRNAEEVDHEKFPPAFNVGNSDTYRPSPENIQKIVSSTSSVSQVIVEKLPESACDLLVAFNPSQRLAIYDHVVNVTKDSVRSLQLNEIDLVFEKTGEIDGESQGKSLFDQKSEERNAKRRRINYKQSKKVHTSNKTHTEVMAEVIKNQMDLYQQWVEANTPKISAPTRDEAPRRDKSEHRKSHKRSRSPRHKEGKKQKKERKRSRSRDKDRSRHGKSKKRKKSRER